MFRVRKLTRLLRRTQYRRALTRGVAATVEHADFDFPSNLRTVLDVGANRGQFACFALERFPDAQLICFEPLESEYQVLEHLRRTLRWHDRLVCHPVGLGRESSEAVLHIARRRDSSSLLPISLLQSSVFPGTDEVGTMTVSVRRLDQMILPHEISRPSLLKIDVQGSELEVLIGAGELLAHIDEVLVECSFVEFYTGQPLFNDVFDYLTGQGFRLEQQRASATTAEGSILQADLWFRRPPS